MHYIKTIEDTLSNKLSANIHQWTFDLSRSNLMQLVRNQQLHAEILDFKLYKPFAEKYGFILDYPERYVNIYLISSFLKSHTLLCYLDGLDDPFNALKHSLKSYPITWAYSTIITYDQQYNYAIAREGFRKTGHLPAFKSSDVEKATRTGSVEATNRLLKSYQSTANVYALSTSDDVYKSVGYGIHADAYKCTNYFGLNAGQDQSKLIHLLSQPNKPTLDQVLSTCDFLIVDFRGEDLGYAKQLKLYSKTDMSDRIEKVAGKFHIFAAKMRLGSKESKTLIEYEISTNTILKKQGC